ncbi:MAG: TOTE conflict system archaeo-eukaryotic primase domain-containing protein [Ktedonobacteraceae bacterium]
MYTDTDLFPLMQTCIGRHDDYAVQRADGLYYRVGRRLTYDVLRRHIAGVETIGTYLIDEQGCCRFAVFDADSDAGLLALLEVQAHLTSVHVPSYVEASRRGAHLRVMFSAPAAAALVRRWLVPYCPAGVEFYPKQDGADWDHPGSLMRVPFGVHRRSGRRYPFVVIGSDGQLLPVVSSVKAALVWLSTVERATVPAASSLPECDTVSPAQQKKYPAKKVVGCAPVAPLLTIRDWCAAQHPITLIGRYVELDSRGMGCCPFGWHHSDGSDSHPSFKVYEPTYAGGYCWYCHVWQQGGSVFDFLLLYLNLEVRELWHRILSGEQF